MNKVKAYVLKIKTPILQFKSNKQQYYFIILLTDIKDKMLSERKRFNYMGNSSYYHGESQKRFQNQSNYKSFGSNAKESSMVISKIEEKQNIKKVEDLEITNKKIVEETTKQFKKLESDVQRVERILQEKEIHLTSLKSQILELKNVNNTINQQKNILIEAIFEKDLIIKEFQKKIQELLKNQEIKQNQTTPIKFITNQIETKTQSQTQTETINQGLSKEKYNEVVSKALEMEDQVYKLKQDLFSARNRLKVVTQQFEAYKILKQIENIQSQ